jgi:DNA topoisomerase-1
LHKALKGGKALRGELKTFAAEKSAPKTVDSCLKKIKVLSEKIEKDEINIQKRDENKNVALGTSRINYMDPRITISWCK